MIAPSAAERARHLHALLAPLHDAARASARRLCRSSDEGDDLFHDAALRALDRLGDLRDETRFRAWFYAVLLSTHRARTRRGFWRRLVSLDSDGEDAPAEPVGADGSAWEEERFRAARMAETCCSWRRACAGACTWRCTFSLMRRHIFQSR